MLVRAIKTRKLISPKDNLLSVIKESILSLKEKSVIVITSKVVSIWEGRCIKTSEVKSKEELIKKEANYYIAGKVIKPGGIVMLTIKDNILIPNAGIDESNANGYYILWPENAFESAKKIYNFIKKEFKLKQFGIIISDSHTTPLRTGIMGIGIAYYGFHPLRDYRGKKDIFNRELKMSQTNIVDSLAASAVYTMGEGDEQTPIAIIEDVGNVKFTSKTPIKDILKIQPNIDIYAPLLKGAKWQKNKK